jgi:hypothetical protein
MYGGVGGEEPRGSPYPDCAVPPTLFARDDVAAPASRASRPDTLKKQKPPPVRTGRGLRLECDRTKDHAAANTTPTSREQSKHRAAPRVKSA